MIKKVVIDKANRIYQIPPDIFSFTKDKSRQSLIKKTELVDIARFNWPVPFENIQDFNIENLKPASESRLELLKNKLAEWFSAYHNIKILNPKEIYIGGSISRILFNISLSFLDRGDIVFVPELGMPLYRKVITACGAEPVNYGISGKNNWQPDFEKINSRIGSVARLMFLNSPHNPTGAVCDEKELANLVYTASRENIIVINDAAYQSISERKIPSLLSVEGGKKVGVEVYSFSYLLGLPALPFGFAVGHREIINGLKPAGGRHGSHIH